MDPDRSSPVIILCGGRGTRLQEHTASIPKPLVEIGGLPILWHVIQLYACQGWRRFVLCLGYKGEMIESFAAGTQWPSGTDIACVDTGLDTPTGGRLHRVREHVGEQTCHLTYADGVADVDLGKVQAHHRQAGTLATMTVVRPELQFGVTELDDSDRVVGFREKPRADHWINGGFFCLEPAALDYVHDDSVLEREPLERLAEDGQLSAFRHNGFWDCMDTYKDAILLNDLWENGRAPWKVWD
ncbi:MAG TPA: sugar phosphate nucleotidyltransferase [Solirubrobacteraceae bacterium]|jgi:glucose-1-phosphate cytidylyltransferase|nr:sugar phosphate nucleotidyltransferase [Solirubrobacteraceae bacterium]